MKNQLLLGCGHSRQMRVYRKATHRETPPAWENLFTLDIDGSVKPDLVCDLDQTDWVCMANNTHGAQALHDSVLPNDIFLTGIKEDFFDEVHAYEVLEHLGYQGNVHDFFHTFHNIHRILKPDGLLLATTPSRFGGWLWGDPGHRRVILPESLPFLDQEEYHKQCGEGPHTATTAMSDYRYIWHGDFKIIESYDDRKATHSFVLQAIKPARTFQ